MPVVVVSMEEASRNYDIDDGTDVVHLSTTMTFWLSQRVRNKTVRRWKKVAEWNRADYRQQICDRVSRDSNWNRPCTSQAALSNRAAPPHLVYCYDPPSLSLFSPLSPFLAITLSTSTTLFPPPALPCPALPPFFLLLWRALRCRRGLRQYERYVEASASAPVAPLLAKCLHYVWLRKVRFLILDLSDSMNFRSSWTMPG